MKEIVIISGKGGTGKTSITASFAALAAGKAVFADCDVDAADLHLIFKPSIRRRTEFRSGHKTSIKLDLCTGCGKCVQLCRFGAMKSEHGGKNLRYRVDPVSCEGCGVCVRFCPSNAIDFTEGICGEWFVSDTRFGPLVHAKLGIASENSGKLVTLVRNEAKQIARKTDKQYVLIDGSPGIGCPVIASLTAANLALIVTEPTVSGDHDLRRIASLTKRLGIPSMVCVNKWDINPDVSQAILEFARKQGIQSAGCVRYDKAVTGAQRSGMALPEFVCTGITEDIKEVWNKVEDQAKI